MNIDFSLPDELADALADAFGPKLKQPNETKRDFVSRMMRRHAKRIAVDFLVRAASKSAAAQAKTSSEALDG